MKGFVFIAMFFALQLHLHSQEVVRELVAGTIHTVSGDDVEGITLYNTSSQKGTITDANGHFELELAANDRIYVTALQFQPFTVIVDRGVIDSKTLNIYLNPSITQLDEVIVRPYDLTGNVRVDVKEIPTLGVGPGMDLSYEALEFGYGFKDDSQTQIISNAAEEALNTQGLQNGANILGIVGGLVGLLLNKKERESARPKMDRNEIHTALRQRFSDHYITTTFHIPEQHIGEFIYFVEDNGLDTNLFNSENELRLVEHLFEQSRLYKQQRQTE